MTKAVGYVRLSQKKETSESISNQIDLITEYCKIKEYELVKIYKEGKEGIAQSFDVNRKQFNIMTEEAKNKGFEVLVVKDDSRLARDVTIIDNLVKDFKAYGIRIETIFGDDLTKSELITGIKAVVNADVVNRGKLMQQIMTQMKQKKGLPFGAPPFGYKAIVNEAGEKTWGIDKKEADILLPLAERIIKEDGGKVNRIIEEFNISPPTYYRIIDCAEKYDGKFSFTKNYYGAQNRVVRSELLEWKINIPRVLPEWMSHQLVLLKRRENRRGRKKEERELQYQELLDSVTKVTSTY